MAVCLYADLLVFAEHVHLYFRNWVFILVPIDVFCVFVSISVYMFVFLVTYPSQSCACAFASIFMLYTVIEFVGWIGIKALDRKSSQADAYDLIKVQVKVKLSLCFNWEPRHEDVVG
jgi:hypothetical protein